VGLLGDDLDAIDLRTEGVDLLLAVLGMEGDDLVLSDANLVIRSGAGSTHGADNGLGNLILGYNAAPGAQTGSHNLVIGDGSAFVSSGGLLVGQGHSASAPGVALIGGGSSLASAEGAVVIGGEGNLASGRRSVAP
jgi:hypothetical protein